MQELDYESGEFGQGGQALRAVELTYRGDLGEAFVQFALDRARRLSLDGWISARPDTVKDTVKLAAQGPQALVDAFEIVCSLGPIDARVTDWDRSDIAPGLNRTGFERR